MQNNKESLDSLFFITKNIQKKKIAKTKNYKSFYLFYNYYINKIIKLDSKITLICLEKAKLFYRSIIN